MAQVTESKGYLLLLPAIASAFDQSSLIAAYKTTFEALLPTLNQEHDQGISRLDVGVIVNSGDGLDYTSSRSNAFPKFQKLLKSIYSLVGIVAAQKKLELDFPGGLDVRIFILDSKAEKLSEKDLQQDQYSGPVINIQTFALSSRSYQAIYTVEGEAAGALVDQFVSVWQSKRQTTPHVQRLPCGPAITNSKSNRSSSSAQHESKNHKSVAVGGTFDHIHIGHKLLLTATVFLADPNTLEASTSSSRLITIGITGSELLKNKKYASQVESWDERQQRTADFVESILVFHPDISSIRKIKRINDPGPNGRVVRVSYGDDLIINYTEISDPFGPTITDENISAIAISLETRAGGKAVNDRRKEKGWNELEVFEVDVLDANPSDEIEAGEDVQKESFESKISSTEIRRRLELKNKKGDEH